MSRNTTARAQGVGRAAALALAAVWLATDATAGDVLRSGTYVVTAGRPGSIIEKFNVTRAGDAVTSIADATHPGGRNLHVVTVTDASSGALREMTIDLKAKGLPGRTVHATVHAGHVSFSDTSSGTESKLPLKVGALPLFVDPGGLLVHMLTLLTQRYDWLAGGEQLFWVYDPGFGEMRVRLRMNGRSEGKLKDKKVNTLWLAFSSSELLSMRIEVDADDYQVLRLLGPKGETLATLQNFVGGPPPGDTAPAAAPARPAPGPAPGAP